MKKANKILMVAVAILLSLVLITTSIVSGIFAKFILTKTAESGVKLEKFGLTLTVSSSYSTATPTSNGEGISITVPITMNAATNYDGLVKFTFSNTPNVSKVKLILTMKIEGVENFAVSGIEGIPNGNHIPLGFTSKVHNEKRYVNTPNYWCMPTDNADLAKTVIAGIVEDNVGAFSTMKSISNNDSLEVVVWENSAYKITSFELGVRPYGTTDGKPDTGYSSKGLSNEEANLLQTQLIEREPTLTVTYTVSIQQA